jgi:hypothetical protein
MSIKAVKVGQVLYATDWRREGQLTECTVIEANIVNKWDNSKNSYVIRWTDGTEQAIDGPHTRHNLNRNPAIADRARALSDPAVVAERQDRQAAERTAMRPTRLAKIAAELKELQPTEAELSKFLAKVRG